MADNNNNNINENEEKNKKRAPLLILIFIIVFVLVFSGVYFGVQLYNKHIIDVPPTSTTEPTTAATELPVIIENPIDFAALQAQNSDIYAWITINDTEIDYPIVQSSVEDDFYLKHKAEDQSWSASGAIYTQSLNSKNFKDTFTVIYGHNGYGDTMFTTLHRFEKEEFFNSHPYFYIYTPEHRLTYQVVSAFKYDDRHILNSFDFNNVAEIEAFQDFIQNPDSAIKNVRTDLDTDIDSSSRIVILSTCITNQKSNRFLVCGVLVNDEQTY